MNALLVVLLPILMTIESSNNPNAVGDNGKAVGVLQIHKIMVDDVNRIAGYKKFTYKDRWSPVKSKQIARDYFNHYCKYSSKQSRMKQLVIMGRKWNGGPRGHRRKATVKYGLKVAKAYEEAYASSF